MVRIGLMQGICHFLCTDAIAATNVQTKAPAKMTKNVIGYHKGTEIQQKRGSPNCFNISLNTFICMSYSNQSPVAAQPAAPRVRFRMIGLWLE